MNPFPFLSRFNDLRSFSRLSKVSQACRTTSSRKTPWSGLQPASPAFPGSRGPFLLHVLPIVLGLGLGLGLVLTGCQDPKPRTYTEIAFKPNPEPAGGMGGPMMGGGPMGAGAMPPMMNASPVDIKVTWKLPEGWIIKDSANGMRIGSFGIPSPDLANTGELDPKSVDVSVVQLAGNAGGLKANIQRWMGQVGLKATPDEMDELIKAAKHFKTRTGQDGMIVDLTDKLSGDMTQGKSIYGAVIATAEYTVFVKAMGEIERVVESKPQVKTFFESLSIAGPQS